MPDRDALAGSLQRFGLERDRLRAALARQAGISSADLDALEHLEAGGSLTQRELGERLLLTSGAITMLVDRLERQGWVSRRRHPTDRRYVLLDLTLEAMGAIPAPLGAYHAAIRELTGEIAPEHRSAMISFLDRAADAAAKAVTELRE